MIEVDNQQTVIRFLTVILSAVLVLILAACDGQDPTPEATVIPPAEASLTTEVLAEVPATWTAIPQIIEDVPDPTEEAPPTNTTVPTITIVPTSTEIPPTDTLEPTVTHTPRPSATPTAKPPSEPIPTVPPTSPPEPTLGVNLLPNGSFEEGHYNQNGVPELQLPNGWRLEWDEGPTGAGNETWDYYVRPEARVLSTAFLPPEEHGLFIFNGQHTVKIFKGSGPVSFRLLTDVTLDPGTYVIEAKMFADIVEKWENNAKVWPEDPSAASFHFIVGDGGTFWTEQNYGQVNVYNWTFTVDNPQTIKVGIALRGLYAISNNGWFIDDLSLRRIE